LKVFILEKGFTLIELLIVIAIIGIISAIGVPLYSGYVDNAKANSAKNSLRSIYIEQQEYFSDNNSYYSSGVACSDFTSNINNNLFSGSAILSNKDFYFCITQDSPDDFTAKAFEVGGSASFTLNNKNEANF
jgi:prepilin-type N-terminal cleavage/methylation domain-containing protein